MAELDRYAQVELETLLLSRYLTPVRHSAVSRSLERSWYLLLTRIQAQGPMSIGELSHALMLDVSTLNRQTAALTKAGFLERVTDPDGGMARKFRMTSAGHEALAADRSQNIEGIQKIMADWDPGEVEELARLVRKFTHAIETRLERPWPRG